MEVTYWRTCPHKDSMRLEEHAAEVEEVEHRSSRFVEELGEGEVASSAEAVVESHMVKRVYRVGGDHAYTSAVEPVAAVENKGKQQEAGVPLVEAKDVATRAARVNLSERLST